MLEADLTSFPLLVCLDQFQTRCSLPHYQIRLHPPVRPGNRDLHLHEQDQRGDHFCHGAPRAHGWNHWSEQERTGTAQLLLTGAAFSSISALRQQVTASAGGLIWII